MAQNTDYNACNMLKRSTKVALSCALVFFLLSACQPDISTDANQEVKRESRNIPLNIEQLPSDFSAHWVSPNLLLMPPKEGASSYHLFTAQRSTELTKIDMPASVKKRYPHLATFNAFTLEIKPEEAKKALKNNVFVAMYNEQNKPFHIAHTQNGEVLDVLYTSGIQDADEERDLGATISSTDVRFKLWAPTATQVTVKLFNADKSRAETPEILLVQEERTGMWLGTGDKNLTGKYYQYEISVYHPASNKVETLTTTDPYSLSLSTNSIYSQIVDLNGNTTQPSG